MHTPLLWLDIETTGLSPHTDLMLEAALVLTDSRLNIVRETDLVIGWADIRSVEMSDFVRDMHERNGLFDAVRESDLCLREVERLLLHWIDMHDCRDLYMAGSGVHFDRNWLKVQMPALACAWHYRNLDLTTLRYFFGDEKKDPPHRALTDLRQNIENLRNYAARAHTAGLITTPTMAVAG